MKKKTTIFLMLFIALISFQIHAQEKQVLYLTNSNATDEEGAASVPGDDAITRMLNADDNFVVTAGTIDGVGAITPSDLSSYDLIIVQENVGSGNAAFKPEDGPLALKNITVPVIYCKSEAFRDGRAITDADAGIASNKSSLSVTVASEHQSNPLFSGIDFSGGNDVRLFFNTANDNGTAGDNKTGLKVLNKLDISNAAGGTLATTPEVEDAASSIVINHIPAGTQLGESAGDAASVDIVALAFGYGPQVRADGVNITSEALTIWRNAAYVLTGLDVPTTLYENTQELSMVLYLNNANTNDEGGAASVPGDDAITRMLNADDNFSVTAGTIDGSGVISPSDLSSYDLIIVQESVSSGNSVFIPDAGALALKNLTVPVIYCKSEAFRNAKAVTDADAGIASNKSSVSVTVPAEHQSNPLFSGIDFTAGDDVRLFLSTANDNGTAADNKTGLKVLNKLDISNAAGGTLATTPEVEDAASSIVINHIPAGTQLGEVAGDAASVDIVALAFGYGPQVRADGKNITSEALTIWRNAAYVLTGKTVPTTLYDNGEIAKKILYVNQEGVGQGEGASAPGSDPVIKMFKADDNFYVEYVETPKDGSNLPDINGYQLVIVQETLSSDAPMLQPDGVLGIKNTTVPVIYNKTWAFRNGRAITDADASVTATQNVSVTAANTNHFLFSGIDFTEGNDIRIFKKANANDDGSVGGNKGIDVLNDIDLSSPGAASAATVPEVTDATKAFVINYLPSGTQIGEAETDVLNVDAVALSFSYGAMVLGDGENISPQALTIWRNAAYALIYGIAEVPTTLVENPDFVLPRKILYVNQEGVGQGEGASAPGADPVINMLYADANFEVTYIETPADGSTLPEISDYDLVIAQETISSGAAMLMPGGALGVKDITTPVIYNKTWAFRDGRAVTDADASVTATQNVSITAVNSNHFLFSGIDFTESDDIRIFKEANANDDGSVGGTKGIDVLNGLDINNAIGATAATVPEVLDASQAIVVNYIPAGTQLGEAETDVLGADAVALSFSYGATILGDGANVSPQALTIWRNAVYALTFGIADVPDTLVENPKFTLSIDKPGEVSDVSSHVRAIKNKVYVSNVKMATEVNIYSITGALVKTVKTNNDMDFEFRSGLYIATVKTLEGTKSVKFIVSH
ncbi:T9SS type A sorting domain-containing protein [Formosa sp. A9]|uniref:T9SS type A sorting domain-containing protein n=1 Tax=Formosa sp. A9 TaxID=3442641 RepID=UPI003EC0592C